MKKIIALLLIVVFTCSLISCDSNIVGDIAETTTESLEDQIKSAVRSRILVEIALKYDIQGVPTITTYINQIDETRYEVTGKVSVKDKYGDSYTGKYDSIVKYNPEIGSVSSVDLDVGSLYKD